MNVFELFAKLGLDTSEYDEGLDESEKKASSFGSKLGGALSTGAKVAGVGLAAVGAGVVAVGKNLSDNVSALAQYGDNIDKSSQKLGVSAEFYQEWEAVLQHSGTSMSSMTATFKTLANATAQTTDAQAAAFDKLGLSVDDLRKLSTEEVFESVIYALQDMEEGTERTAIASDLLGRGAMEMGALLNTSAEDTQAMIDTVHNLGGVLSDTAVKDAAAYQDALQDMQTSMSGLKNNLNAEFLPAVTNAMNGLSLIFAGDESGLGQINAGVSDFTVALVEQLPKILDVATNIVEGLATGILENIPQLVTVATDVVSEFVRYTIENLPLLFEGAVEIINSLALGIAQSLPELIPTIVDVVLSIVETLIDNVDLLIDASIALIIGLAEGLINAVPKLIEKAPVIVAKLVEAVIKNAPKILQAGVELILSLVTGIVNSFGKLLDVGKDIVDSVKDGFKQKIEDAKDWGKDMIENFVGGIKEKWGNLKDSVSNVAQTVKDFLGFSEPKEGPLSNFHTYAPDMMELFTKGIADNEDMLTDQIAKTFDISSSMPVFNNGRNYDIINSGRGGYAEVIVGLLNQLVNKEPIEISANEDGIFNIVRRKNREYTRTRGVSALI